MTLDEFRRSVAADSAPPPGLTAPLEALWRAANDEWDSAHALAQSARDPVGGAWVHAHLHRIEGDLPNAAGWYRRAGKPVSEAPLDEERDEIAEALLADAFARPNA